MGIGIFSLLIIALGVYFLLKNSGVIDYNIGHFIKIYWPAILIFIGLKMIYAKIFIKRKFKKYIHSFERVGIIS